MEVNAKQIEKLKNAYKENLEELKNLKDYISENGITDEGISDVCDSFEQGYNNALVYVFNILKIDY